MKKFKLKRNIKNCLINLIVGSHFSIRCSVDIFITDSTSSLAWRKIHIVINNIAGGVWWHLINVNIYNEFRKNE